MVYCFDGNQFTRRKKITISTTTATPVLYQVMVTVTYNINMQADFDDIRFATKTGIALDFWLESKTDSSTANIWVELADAIGASGSDYIYMYYGNPSLTSTSNGANTFIDFTHFDDLTGFTQQLGTWSTSSSLLHTPSTSPLFSYLRRDVALPAPPYVASFRIKITTERYNSARGVLFEGNDPISRTASTMHVLNTQTNTLYHVDDETTWSGVAAVTDANTWYIGNELIKTDANVATVWTDGRSSQIATLIQALNSSGTGHFYGFVVHETDASFDVDWLFVRKYVATEPTNVFGNEEYRRRQIIIY